MSDVLDLLNEDTTMTPTGPAAKRSVWFLASVLIGCTICVPVFVMGAQIANSLPLPSFILAVFLGGLLASCIAIATGIVGQRTGLPTSVIAQVAFGRHGAMVANLAMAFCSIGWFGIQTSVFSQSFVKLAYQAWGLHLNTPLVMIVSGLVMSSTAVIGYRALGKLSIVAVPLLIILLMIPWVVFYYDGRLAVAFHHPSNTTMTMGMVIAMVAGAYSFSTTMPDVTRFMRNARDTVLGLIANFALAYPLLLILTGIAAVVAHDNDYINIMFTLGYGGLAILVLFLATWTTNDTNVYTGALSINPFLPKIPRWQIAAAIGVFGTLFAIVGIFDHFMSWLIFTGNLFAPMAGVYVADYWLNQSRYRQLDRIPSVRWPQLVAWMGGLAVGLATTGPDNMGFGVTTLTTIPMVDGLLAAGIIQLILHKVLKP